MIHLFSSDFLTHNVSSFSSFPQYRSSHFNTLTCEKQALFALAEHSAAFRPQQTSGLVIPVEILSEIKYTGIEQMYD